MPQTNQRFHIGSSSFSLHLVNFVKPQIWHLTWGRVYWLIHGSQCTGSLKLYPLDQESIQSSPNQAPGHLEFKHFELEILQIWDIAMTNHWHKPTMIILSFYQFAVRFFEHTDHVLGENNTWCADFTGYIIVNPSSIFDHLNGITEVNCCWQSSGSPAILWMHDLEVLALQEWTGCLYLLVIQNYNCDTHYCHHFVLGGSCVIMHDWKEFGMNKCLC